MKEKPMKLDNLFRMRIVKRPPNRVRRLAKRDRVAIHNDTAERRPQTITYGTVHSYCGCGMYCVRVDPEFLVDVHDDGTRVVGGEILRRLKRAPKARGTGA